MAVVTLKKKPRKFQGPKAAYFIHEQKNVVIDAEALSKWDDIKELDIDEITYDMKKDANGTLVKGETKIWKIVGYTTRTEMREDAYFEKEIEMIGKVTEYSQLQRKVLAEADSME